MDSSKGVAVGWRLNQPLQGEVMDSVGVQAVGAVVQVPSQDTDHAAVRVNDRQRSLVIPGQANSVGSARVEGHVSCGAEGKK